MAYDPVVGIETNTFDLPRLRPGKNRFEKTYYLPEHYYDESQGLEGLDSLQYESPVDTYTFRLPKDIVTGSRNGALVNITVGLLSPESEVNSVYYSINSDAALAGVSTSHAFTNQSVTSLSFQTKAQYNTIQFWGWEASSNPARVNEVDFWFEIEASGGKSSKSRGKGKSGANKRQRSTENIYKELYNSMPDIKLQDDRTFLGNPGIDPTSRFLNTDTPGL